MPILTSVAAALACAGVPGSMLAFRRLKTRREERAVKDALLPYLDRLILQAETREPPFESLGIHGSPDVDGVVRTHACFIHFLDLTHVHVSRRRPFLRKSGPWQYALDFKHPALEDGRFPGYGRVCLSPWFVERMEKLFRLLEAYPPEDLAAARRERAFDEEMAGWDDAFEEVEALTSESDEEEGA